MQQSVFLVNWNFISPFMIRTSSTYVASTNLITVSDGINCTHVRMMEKKRQNPLQTNIKLYVAAPKCKGHKSENGIRLNWLWLQLCEAFEVSGILTCLFLDIIILKFMPFQQMFCLVLVRRYVRTKLHWSKNLYKFPNRLFCASRNKLWSGPEGFYLLTST